MENNNYLIMLKAEKRQAELRLRDSIKTVRHIIDSLERKLDNNNTIYISDGIQGNSTYLESYLSQFVAYDKSISYTEKALGIDENENEESTNIKFTEFIKGKNWVNGLVNDGEYSFSSKLFDEGSVFGINDGRVSKLCIWNSDEDLIVNYDRGWDIEPKVEYQNVYQEVLEFLENAPKTRFK